MRILITGHMGFIGSKLVPVLESQGHEVIGIDLKDGYDIFKFSYPQDYDIVYHLAAQTDVHDSILYPSEDARTNILGTIEVIKKAGCKKFIYIASAASEDINSPYGLSKRTGEEYVKLLSDNYVICTLPNVYGPGGHGVVEKFIDQEILTVYGFGEQTRTFVHIDDVIKALVLCADWRKGTYTLGGEYITIRELAEMFDKEIAFVDSKEGEVIHSYMSNNSPNWINEIKLKEYINDRKKDSQIAS